jgi:hypothetical protein
MHYVFHYCFLAVEAGLVITVAAIILMMLALILRRVWSELMLWWPCP